MKLSSRAIYCVTLLCCLLLSSQAVRAQSSDVSSDSTLVVTANRYPTNTDQVGSAHTTISRDEIEARGELTVSEILRQVPGLEVVQTGGLGRTASIFIRGAESDHTLILIDGIRANDNTTGQFDIANLKAENIQRIEIIRGPQSVLYGSEAIGGVINIITRKAEEYGASVVAQGGSFGTQEYRASAQVNEGPVYSSLAASYVQSDGISAANASNGNSEGDSYDNFTISNRTGITFLDDGLIETSVRYSTAETELDGFEFGVGPVDAPFFVQETDTLVGSVKIQKSVTDWFTPSVQLGLSDSDSKGNDPDTEFNNFTIDNQSQTVLTLLDFSLAEGATFTVGYSYEIREGVNRGNFEERRYVNAFFAQQQLALAENLFLTGGVRYDDDSDFGEAVTFRTTGSYLVDGLGTRIHASYGTGFKAPTFNELFFPNFGNPDLDAETSWGYDVGIEQSIAQGFAVVDVTFFHNEIDDLITFDSETFLASNIDEAKALGYETSLSVYPCDWFDAATSYTYTDSENKATGRILPRRPRHRGVLSLTSRPIEDLQLTATYVLVNSRRDSDMSRLDNYEVLDLSTSYQLTENLKPFIRMDNVFDEDYEEVNGFGVAGFSVFAGIEASI